jgi:flagellar L-ring protein precursor FlgH
VNDQKDTIVRIAARLWFTTLLVLSCPALCSAQSLWERRDPKMTFLFFDTQARRVGDLLTIIVNEDTDVDNKDKRSLNKDTSANSKLDLSFASTGVLGNSSGTLSNDDTAQSDRAFDGNSSFASEREFSDRLTVAVLDVLPNGNLVVGGRRRVMVENDARTLVISGVVRSLDVSADNTVPSRYVSQFEMFYEGEGAESKFVNQGWLGRAANWLWPF